ncbi:hypothetical protein JOF56_008889 [Kibdelosporangium banguiense]|uniref:Xaa-Pro dipeptidyl-peptidase C-terminal domain-containing protein n=1 Tax=Kibdelosporangium banguiense TaxID=1365924 RepID=A0ABS4TVU6_9PSEU|nr:hypothetical protein [Kibdelosporangium banguiense]MBP2328504.1 hypothetical protein [Kibdelosporangium banguiense]
MRRCLSGQEVSGPWVTMPPSEWPETPTKPWVKWSMLPQDYEFKAGHRLGLILTGTNDDEPGIGAKVTIDLAGTSVSLPLVTATSNGK